MLGFGGGIESAATVGGRNKYVKGASFSLGWSAKVQGNRFGKRPLQRLSARAYGAFPIHQRTLATIFQVFLGLRVMASYSPFSGCRTSVWS